jgi:Ca2+-binding RTX toxin-like protein
VRGVLDVEGGAGNDTIKVYRDTNRGGNLVVNVNGVTSTFSTLAVSRILVFGNRRGDDILIGQTGPHLGLGVIAVGGDGDDVIHGGDGNDTIVGGDHDQDTLWGGAGDDSFPAGGWEIHGDDGDDVVTAYANIGTFTGGAGHDRLASGFARYLLSTHFSDFDSAEDAYAQVP